MSPQPRPVRLPVFYGWIIVLIAFITMGIGVNARTAFSLLVPPIIAEYGWDRGLVAGAFSFGFLVSAFVGPFVGRLMDIKGPRVVVEIGVVFLVLGLGLGALAREPWHFYLTLGLLVGLGGNFLGYGIHSQFLPNWFVQRRGLAIGIAFSGVGLGSIILMPWMQIVIAGDGWRQACLWYALLAAVVLFPLNLLLRKRPQDIGLLPDGEATAGATGHVARLSNIVDPAWAATEWTLARALRTARFWWISLGYFCGLYAWYAVQVHQTKYLTEIGIAPTEAAWALGLVALVGVPGQIVFGHASDRIGREWAWAIGCLGFAICFAALIALQAAPTPVLLYAMVLAQGFLGYSLHLGARADRRRDLRGAAFRHDLRHRHAGGRRRRGRGPVDQRAPLRPSRQLQSGVLDRAGALLRLGLRHLHGGAAQGARRRRTDAENRMSALRRPPLQRFGNW